MATAEELLRGTSEGTVDKTLYVDFDTRTIAIPPSIHQLGVESDDDVKKLTFRVPRHYYDCDLSTFRIFINYMNAKKEGDLFEVAENNLRVTEDTIEFDWVVGRNALAYKGTAIFNVCMKKGSMQPDPENETQEIFVVDQELNTTVAKLPVLEGLETGEAVAVEYADIFMQWEEALFGIENSAKQNIILKGEEVINTVNKQLDIKIPEYMAANSDRFKGNKGDKGDTPTLTESKNGKVTTVTVVDGNGTHTFEINDGADGKDGTSITILGSYSTEAELKAAHPTGNAGDGYIAGGDLYVWNISSSAWKNVGRVQGPAGKNGKDGTNGISPTIETSKTGKVTTITITDVNGTHTVRVNDGSDGSGTGDMLAATYDTNGDGVVNSAENSNKLGGKAADQYALKTDIQKGIFMATYGSTTFAELEAAYNDGCMIIVPYNGSIYYLSVPSSGTEYQFVSITNGSRYMKAISCEFTNDWSELGVTNKFLPITSVSDNGKVLKVVGGSWAVGDVDTATMSATDDGNGNVTLSIGG